MKILRLIMIIFSMMIIAVSCVRVPGFAEAVARISDAADNTVIQETPAIVGNAEEAVFVQSIYLIDGEPDSGTVEVIINGFFPDGCTVLSEVKQTRNRSTFSIRLLTKRNDDENCSSTMEPFKIFVPLDVRDFMPGQICKVEVYEYSLEFSVGIPWQPEKEGK